MLLPDVNVWVALTFDKHPNHPSSKSWFDALTDQVCYFCRLTQQGFLRIATNQKAMGLNALTLDDAWSAYDALLGDPASPSPPRPPDWKGTGAPLRREPRFPPTFGTTRT